MNEFVELVVDPSLMRNSLIFTGLTFRTFSAVVSDCVRPFVIQEALPTRSPLNASGPDVILKVALTVAPGAIGPGNDLAACVVQPLCAGMLSLTPVAGAPVVFVNVTVVSC